VRFPVGHRPDLLFGHQGDVESLAEARGAKGYRTGGPDGDEDGQALGGEGGVGLAEPGVAALGVGRDVREALAPAMRA
jgi:hypothetical protein